MTDQGRMPGAKKVLSRVDARDRVLEAALASFADLGFHGATFRDIARRAGVSQGLICHHFTDKERVWSLVAERVLQDFEDYLAPVLSVGTVDETTVPNILKTYMSYWQEHPAAFRIQRWRLLGAPEGERLARAERINRRIVPIFAQAQKAGYIRNDIPAGQAMVTVGALIQYRLHSALELSSALAVTSDVLPDDAGFLRYLHGLIAASPVRR